MAAIFVRTIIIYITLIAIMRFLGKRQIGQMQISELITAFLLSELASQPLANASVPLVSALIPILTLICLEVFFSFLPTKLTFLKKFVDSAPTVIIGKGKIDMGQMSKMRMTLEDLLCELRLAGYSSPGEIEYAILEQNGRLSFFPKSDGGGIFHPLIIDGKSVPHALRDAGRDENWIRSALLGRSIKDASEVFLMVIDDSGKYEIITRKECGK